MDIPTKQPTVEKKSGQRTLVVSWNTLTLGDELEVYTKLYFLMIILLF